MDWTDDCICDWWMTSSKIIEFFKINASRTELRCGRCHGLIGWCDNGPAQTRKMKKKIMPFKRTWSEEECLSYAVFLIEKISGISQSSVLLNSDNNMRCS